MRKAFWHKASWDRFLDEDLPGLLGDRVDIAEYRHRVHEKKEIVEIRISGPSGNNIDVSYDDIPAIGEDGSFEIDGSEVVVVPVADTEDLLRVRCCGRLLYDFLEPHISKAPDGFFVEEDSVRSWLPLSDWIKDFFLDYGQVMDSTNPISRVTHLNRVRIDDVGDFAPASQVGKTCPVETPTGPNIGKVLTVARGAVIENDTVVVADTSPEGSLGLAASMIPFIEHSDPARLMMGANMMRQWIPPVDGEPALVRTGLEPDDYDFWCGYNLLCAFTSVGVLNCEDGIVISEDAAHRMRYEIPLEIGDKLSTRHGDKGVISAILPASEMPRLEDGTSVDLVFSFSGLHTRMNSGLLFEAVTSRIARSDGKPVIIPPFAAPSRRTIAGMLEERGMPSNGMERLERAGGDAPQFPTLAGWVYWGRTRHNVSDKLRCMMRPEGDYERGGSAAERYFLRLEGIQQRVGDMEYWILRNAGAYNVACENAGLRSAQSSHAARLADLVSGGGELPSSFPSAPLLTLQKKLAAAGINLDIDEGGLDFSWYESGAVALAEPLEHPWCQSKVMSKITPDTENPLWSPVVRENEKLKSLVESGAPESLLGRSRSRLKRCFSDYMESIIQTRPSDLSAGGNILFSVRSVIVPSNSLDARSVGVPEEAAWELFGPLAAREVGSDQVTERTPDAVQVLDQVMARQYVLFWKAPSVEPTSTVALRPVRVPHRAIELNPLLCKWLNADFDGDQVGLYLPLTDAAQKEIVKTLSVSAHLEGNPRLIEDLLPPHEAVWGLAVLWLTDEGRKAINSIAGEISTHGKLLTQWELQRTMTHILEERGSDKAISVLEELMALGFSAAAASGASLDPFVRVDDVANGDHWDSSPSSVDEHQLFESLEGSEDYLSSKVGPQLIMTKGSIRGSIQSLVRLLHRRYETPGQGVLEGIAHDEFMKLAQDVRRDVARIVFRWEVLGRDMETTELSKATTVLARARRSDVPGVVFAAAASRQETDPLTDLDARLFAGLVPDWQRGSPIPRTRARLARLSIPERSEDGPSEGDLSRLQDLQ
jgi:hypothetical protein